MLGDFLEFIFHNNERLLATAGMSASCSAGLSRGELGWTGLCREEWSCNSPCASDEAPPRTPPHVRDEGDTVSDAQGALSLTRYIPPVRES